MEESIDLGIDLGTSRTVLFCCTSQKSEVFRFKGSNYISSLIAYSNGEFVIGDKATNILKLSPHLAILHWKRALLYNRDKLLPNDKESHTAPLVTHKMELAYEIKYKNQEPIYLTPMECLKVFIKLLFQMVQDYYHKSIRSMCITTPVQYDIKLNQAIAQIAKEVANCKICEIAHEPVAAALSAKYKGSGYFLVYDFGGGTFDVAIVQYNDSDRAYDIRAKDGVPVGGDDIDNAFSKYLLDNYLSEYRDDLLKRSNEMTFRSMVETVKIELSSKEEIDPSYASFLSYLDEENGILVRREEFERIAAPFIDKTIDCVRELTKEYSIEKIILVGGSSHIPLVQQKLRILFNNHNKEFFYFADSTKAVAEGGYLYMKGKQFATKQHYSMSKPDDRESGKKHNRSGVDVIRARDSIAADIGVCTGDDGFFVLIKRGLRLGSSAKFDFQKKNETSKDFCIEFAQGSSKYFSNNRHIATFCGRSEKSRFYAQVECYDLQDFRVRVFDMNNNRINGTLTFDGEGNVPKIMLYGDVSEEYVETEIQTEANDNEVNLTIEIQAILRRLKNKEDDMEFDQFDRFNKLKKSFYYATRSLHEVYNELIELEKEIDP